MPTPRTATLYAGNTRFNADSVEFVPEWAAAHAAASGEEDEAAARTFAVGNYQLNEETREKVGRVYLYQLDRRTEAGEEASQAAAASPAAAVPVAASPSLQPYSLRELSVLDTAAVFDLKWSPRFHADRALLGQADAAGRLILYDYTRAGVGSKSSAQLSPLHTQQVVEGASCLSLDWNNRIHDAAEPTIAVSQSNSCISLWQLSGSGLQSTQSWMGHEYELWIVSFDAHRPHVLYSGADDSLFRGWDTRAPLVGPRSALFTDRSHEAGVCSIQSHPTREHLIATGSYDEQLRVWDTRNMREPLLTHALGGGVWRVRWKPPSLRRRAESHADQLLICAMHNGFAVVDVDVSGQGAGSGSDASVDWSLRAETSATYKAHASLAYGADWCVQPINDIRFAADSSSASSSASASSTAASSSSLSSLVATCSFYDKKLDVWAIEETDAAASTDDTQATPAQVASTQSSDNV